MKFKGYALTLNLSSDIHLNNIQINATGVRITNQEMCDKLKIIMATRCNNNFYECPIENLQSATLFMLNEMVDSKLFCIKYITIGFKICRKDRGLHAKSHLVKAQLVELINFKEI